MCILLRRIRVYLQSTPIFYIHRQVPHSVPILSSWKANLVDLQRRTIYSRVCLALLSYFQFHSLNFLGHPLHKSFNYTRHHFSTLLLPTVSSSGIDPLASLHTPSSEIFVIDCTEVTPPALTSSHQSHHVVSTIYVPRKRRFGSDLEMLARAWCAEKGLNALISRRGRNCIACSIREARALGWKIVLRFG